MVFRSWFGPLAFLLAAAPALAQEPEPPPIPENQGQEPRGQDPRGQEPPVPEREDAPPQEPVAAPKEPPTVVPKIDLAELEKRALEDEPEEVGVALTWADRLRRDARITFFDRSIVEASAALDNPAGIGLRRLAAWMTLGERGTTGDQLRIARAARTEKGLERCAAILALGQPGADAMGLLAPILDDPEAQPAECALFALLRTRRPDARERVAAIAADEKHPRSGAAASLLAFAANPSGERIPRAARTWYELRWEAARAFGGIDGKRFDGVRIAELASSARFCTDVAVAASGRSTVPSARDHLLSVLLRDRGPARIEAAVQAIPRPISRLVESQLWKPADTAEWQQLLDGIEREHAEALSTEVLTEAEEILPVRWKARELLARAGQFDIARFSAVDFPSLAPGERAATCQVLGSLGDPAASTLLARLADDADPGVRGALLVAKLRLDDPSAEEEIDKALADRTRPDHSSVLQALCKNAREHAIAMRLEQFSRTAVGGELVMVAGVLCDENRALGRILVRNLLSMETPPTVARRRTLVRALCRKPSELDRAILVELFPQPGEEDLNRELAVGLARLADPKVRPVLRSALWGSDFDVGVLAGFLLAEDIGSRGIVEDISSPPAGATAETLRRAGFALGEWGGVAALGLLTQAAGSSAARPEVQGALLGVLGARTQ